MGASSSTEKRSFKWRIDGFSSLLEQGEGWSTSGAFDINGFKWYMRMNPMDKKIGDTRNHVSVRLELSRSSIPPDYAIQAVFKFVIYDQSKGHHIKQEVRHDFQPVSLASGSPCMVPLDMLNSPICGFLCNDSCVFGVEFVKIKKIRSDDLSTNLLVHKNKFVSDVYTWNIDDFDMLKGNKCSSEVFDIGGYKWHISLYPNGDKVTNFISLYLSLDKANKLPLNTGVFVDMLLVIKNQSKGKDKKRTGRIQFDTKNSRWGGQKFIQLEDFKNPLNGFLVKNKCTIEASISILGSSKE